MRSLGSCISGMSIKYMQRGKEGKDDLPHVSTAKDKGESAKKLSEHLSACARQVSFPDPNNPSADRFQYSI